MAAAGGGRPAAALFSWDDLVPCTNLHGLAKHKMRTIYLQFEIVFCIQSAAKPECRGPVQCPVQWSFILS